MHPVNQVNRTEKNDFFAHLIGTIMISISKIDLVNKCTILICELYYFDASLPHARIAIYSLVALKNCVVCQTVGSQS